MKLIILGPPGTGKGTQAKILAKRFKLKHISAGDLIRSEEKKKSRLGRILARFTDKGLLAPFRTVDKIVLKSIPKDNFILDGFPRSVIQAREVSKIIKVDFIINIDTNKKIIIKRLLKRAKIEGRKDDTLEVIKNRFKVYEKETKPVLKYFYDNKFKIIKVDGKGKPQTIFKKLEKILGKNKK